MSIWNGIRYTNGLHEVGKKNSRYEKHRSKKYLHWTVEILLEMEKKMEWGQLLNKKEKELKLFLKEKGIVFVIDEPPRFNPRTLLRKNPKVSQSGMLGAEADLQS